MRSQTGRGTVAAGRGPSCEVIHIIASPQPARGCYSNTTLCEPHSKQVERGERAAVFATALFQLCRVEYACVCMCACACACVCLCVHVLEYVYACLCDQVCDWVLLVKRLSNVCILVLWFVYVCSCVLSCINRPVA